MSTLVFLPDGTCRGLYTETIDLSLLGRLEVRRASSIEFDNRLQVWRVRVRGLGEVYCSPSREECLRWEEQYFEAHAGDSRPD